jgi:hypothetical protein
MGLLKCPDCGNDKVSSRAMACPTCGCPLDAIELAATATSADGGVDDSAARVREELEQFKTRFDQADANAQLLELLIAAEDLLVHVCGQQRFESLKHDAENLPPGKRNPWFKNWSQEEQDRKDAVQILKKRIAGIAYRRS